MKKFYYFLLSGLLLSSCASSEWAFDDTYEKTKNPLAYNFNERNDVIEFIQKEEKRFNVIISYDFQTGFNNVENEYYLNEQFQYYNHQPYLVNRNDCYCIYDGTYSRNYNAFVTTDGYKMTYKNKFYGYFYPLHSYNRNCFSFYNSFYTFGTAIRSNIDGGMYVNGLAAHNFDYNDMRYWQYIHTKDYNIKDDGNSNVDGGGSGGTNLNNNGFEFEKKTPLMSQIGLNHPDFVLSNIDFDYNRTSNSNGSIQNAQISTGVTSNGNSSLASNNYVTNDSQSASNPFAIYNSYPGTGIAGNHNVSNNPNDKNNENYDNQAVSTTSNSSATANSRSTSTSRRTDSNYSSNYNSNNTNNTQGGGNNNHKGNVYSNSNGNSSNGSGSSGPRSSSGNYSSGGGGTGSNYGGSGGGTTRR